LEYAPFFGAGIKAPQEPLVDKYEYKNYTDRSLGLL